MAKTFKSWDVDQLVLFPPSVHELVPPGHLAHFVRDLVRDSLDLSAVLKTYDENCGFPPYDSTMMVALLLHAYSSRALRVAADRQGLSGTGGFHGRAGAAESGFSHDQRLSEASPAGAGWAVHAGTPAVPEGRTDAVASPNLVDGSVGIVLLQNRHNFGLGELRVTQGNLLAWVIIVPESSPVDRLRLGGAYARPE